MNVKIRGGYDLFHFFLKRLLVALHVITMSNVTEMH